MSFIDDEKKYTKTHFDLEKCLAFECEDIPYRLMSSMYNLTEEEATEWWIECKKWVWLLAESVMDRKEHPELWIFINDSTFWLDEIWHNFILFTKEYHQFCEENFGFFIYHAPTSKKEREARKERFDLADEEGKAKQMEENERLVEILYEYVYDKLGEETLLKWFDVWAEKYSKENLAKLCIVYEATT